jgi:hypothetical protein
MSTLRQVEKKIQGLALIGCGFKKMWRGHLSTFPKFKKYFRKFKIIFVPNLKHQNAPFGRFDVLSK